jgi:drug/metabolite transporter (DMT)-like permease
VVLGIVVLHEPLTIGIIVGFPIVLIGSIFATGSRAPQSELDEVLSADANLVVNE